MAQTLYRETEASHEARLKAAAEKKEMYAQGQLDPGRPSKRDRRQINKWRGQIHRF